MGLSLAEIKDLLAYGQELGLQQLQTEGLVAIYGQRAVVPIHPSLASDIHDDTANILAHYSAVGREKLQSPR